MKLYDWQLPHAEKFLAQLRKDGVVVDASDTGTGKTYIALWAAKEYKHPLLIVCPKAVIPKWRNLAREAGLSPIDILNVEKLKRSRYLSKLGNNCWIWTLPPGTLVIFDEAHQYGGTKTANAFIMQATRSARLPVVALSATIANSPLRLRALGYLLGLFPTFGSFWNWSLTHGAEKVPLVTWAGGQRKQIETIQFVPEHATAQEGVKKIHEEVFKTGKGYRLRSGESPGFPENQVVVERLAFEKTSEIAKAYAKLQSEIEASDKLVVSQTLALRQQIELLRVPDLAEMVQEMSEEHGVVVFLNFRESVYLLEKALHEMKPSVIIGEQTEDDREAERNFFQDNQTRVCLCTYGAGGLGLDLHDLKGRPRLSVLNPNWSAVQTIQALGRIHRAGALSPAIQKLIYAANTVEEEVASRVEASLNNLSLLQDGDMSPLKGIK